MFTRKVTVTESDSYDVYFSDVNGFIGVVRFEVVSPVPAANFSGSPTSGTTPLTVTFTDRSTNTPTSWNWNFGDGATSTAQNPTHTYLVNGTYTVSLTSTNVAGSNTKTVDNYIAVALGGSYESTTCYDILLSIDPSGYLKSGTPVIVSFILDFRASGGETFPPSSSLQLITDLENPKWTWTLILNDVENPRPQSNSRILELSGWDLAYPSDVEESVSVTLEGVAPSVASTTNKSIIKIQEVDSHNNVVVDCTIDKQMIHSTSGNETYVFVAKWGTYGSGDGQFGNPLDVSIDSSGNVYVVDMDNHRIQKFDSSRAFLAKWGTLGSGDGQFWNPIGVAVDSLGNVFVADRDNHRIQKFNSSGAFLTKWGTYGTENGQFIGLQGVAVDSLGNVYITDNDNNRIQKFNSDGTFLAKWGSEGTGDEQFKSPSGVAVDSSSNVFVADRDNNRIQKFSSDGTFLAKWGTLGSGDGQFYYPRDVSIDSSGNVYVVDKDNQRIQKFDSSRAFLAKWGTSGTGDGQFWYPNGVAVDSSNNVYVADTGNSRVQKFTLSSANPPVAAFTGTPTSGNVPLTVQFTDNSTKDPTTPISSWNWNFGDGSVENATIQNPIHTFTNAGSYTVSLTATSAAGSNTKTVADYITVSAVPPTSSSTVGIFRNGAFYLASSNVNGGGTVNAFGYGLTGDTPLAGDWTGSGKDTIGVYRKGVFYLRNRNTAGGIDLTFAYGAASGDIPVVGDWTGSGKDTVGVFRDGTFFLRNNDGNSDLIFTFGQAGDIPVVGDWTGSGTTTVGIFRNGAFYLASSNTPGGGTLTAFTFGQAGDTPVVGDWNGDGKTEVGIFRNGAFYLASSNNEGGGTLTAFGYGLAGDLPVAGMWTGNGTTPTPTPTPTPTVMPTPEPTQVLPDIWSIDIQVASNGEVINPQIITTFLGGKGMNVIPLIEIQVTRADGVVETGRMTQPLFVGKEVSLKSTTTNNDRAEVWATTPQGDRVKIFDAYIPFRSYD